MATGTAGTTARQYHTSQIHFLRQDIAYTDGAKTFTMGIIPAGSQILNTISGVYVNTVFNYGTNNRLDVGTSTTADLYGTDLALGTKAFVTLDEAATATNVNAFYVSVDTTITCTTDLTGTTGTTGSGVVVIAYVPPNLT